MQTDRRSTRRFALSLPAEACGESPFKSQPIQGRTRNVSANGIYFVCDQTYPKKLLVLLPIHMNDANITAEQRRFIIEKFISPSDFRVVAL